MSKGRTRIVKRIRRTSILKSTPERKQVCHQEAFSGSPIKSQLQHKATFIYHTQYNRNATLILSSVSNACFHF